MYHYTYLLEFPDGMKYVGVHSTKIRPDLDTCYLGSGRGLPPRTSNDCKKIILQTFDTRESAVAYEIEFIQLNNCVASPEYYNLRSKTHDKHGSELSEEHIALISQTHKGRDRSDYGNKYTGNGRTPAQRDGERRMAEKLRGVKNPAKGRKGTDNVGFKPWYSISPNGDYAEYHEMTKDILAYSIGVSYRQIIHRFHHTNEHRRARTLPLKGWTFGNLPRPIECDGE